MPPEVAAELETRVSGIGDFSVYCALRVPGGPAVEPVQRFVTLDGHTYRAHVYGRRISETTKQGVPLHGVMVDGLLALHENVLRELEPGEPPGTNQPIQDLRSAAQKTARAPVNLGAVGHTLYAFASHAHWQRAETLLETAEAGIGPAPTLLAADILQPEALAGNVNPVTPAPLAPSSYTEGGKNVLIMRVDFSDLSGDPGGLTASDVQTIADSQIGTYYRQSSYGRTSLTNFVTKVYRMPKTATYYATNAAFNQLFVDAQTAASADYTISKYDRLIAFFPNLTYIPNSGINWGGLSGVGSPGVLVNGQFSFAIVAHELGHTYGLFHANLWQVADGNPISDSGASAEYLDDFDTMGGNYANDQRTDFNPWFKSMLNWIFAAQIVTVTTNSTNRIYRFDNIAATNTLALVVTKDGSRNYWVGYKRNFTDNPSMMNGAYVVWGYTYNRQSDLLDVGTPGYSDKDAALAIGTSLIDPEANVSITPIAQGGIAPHEYLDIKVHFGATGPGIYLQPQNQTATSGQSVEFPVLASGIPLPGYRWQRKAAGTSTWTNLINAATYVGTATNTLAVNGTTALMNGDQFQCILTNASGTITTAPPAVLTIIPIGVSTLAGHAGSFGSADGTGSAASFKLPTGVAVDGSGNVYVADRNNATVRKVTPQGVVTTIAGLAGNGGSTDGTNNDARLNYDVGVGIDSAGNLYVADTGNQLIRKMTPVGTNWIVTTFAGRPGITGTNDGVATNALFASPLGVAVDPMTNVFIMDWGNSMVRKMSFTGSNWMVSTFAQGLNDPESLAIDRWGNIFVAEQNPSTILKITPAGRVSTLAGSGSRGSQDGTGASATFSGPQGVAADLLGNIYVTDSGNNTIRKITPAGVVTTVTGQPGVTGSTDGVLTNALFNEPVGIATDTSGDLYVADYGNETIRKLVIAPAIPLPRLDGAIRDKSVFRFVLDGPVGSNYVIQTTSDMLGWVPLSTNVIPPGGWTTIQDAITNQPKRFYRAGPNPTGLAF